MAKKRNVKNSSNSKRKVAKQIEEMETSFAKDWFSVLKIVFVVLFFLAAFYLLTVVLVSKDSEDDVEETTIQYEEILAGSSFGMNDDEYLVVYYDFSDSELSELYSAIYSYSYMGSLRLYTVDMSNGFNTKYVTEDESNKNPESAGDLLINGPTLVRIVDGKVEEYIEGSDQVIDYLN